MDDEKVPIWHKVCGGQFAWFLGELSDTIVRSADFQRMDGTQPEYGERFRESCPACGRPVHDVRELQRGGDAPNIAPQALLAE